MDRHKKTCVYILFLLLITIDQLSKYLIRHTGGFYICNPNIAFGINIAPVFFWIIWLSIIFFLIYTIFKNPGLQITNPKQTQNPKNINLKLFNFENCYLFGICNFEFGILLILSGAASNIMDRLYFNCVIDFIDLKIWPVFNLADSFITIGVIIFLISQLTTRNLKH